MATELEKIKAFKKKYPAYKNFHVYIGNSGNFGEVDHFYVEMPYGHILEVDDYDLMHLGEPKHIPIPLTEEEIASINKRNADMLKLLKTVYRSELRQKLFTEISLDKG